MALGFKIGGEFCQFSLYLLFVHLFTRSKGGELAHLAPLSRIAAGNGHFIRMINFLIVAIKNPLRVLLFQIISSPTDVLIAVIFWVGNKAHENTVIKEFTVAHSINRYRTAVHNGLHLMFHDYGVGVFAFQQFSILLNLLKVSSAKLRLLRIYFNKLAYFCDDTTDKK